MIFAPGPVRARSFATNLFGRLHAPALELIRPAATPAQVSKICTTSAPALSCRARYSTEASTRRSIRCAKSFRIAIGEQPAPAPDPALPRRPPYRSQLSMARRKSRSTSFLRRVRLSRAAPSHRPAPAPSHRRLVAATSQRFGIRQRLEPRPFALDKPTLAAERKRNHQNIGKQDRGIETEAPHRLQRHFGRQFRIETQIEKAARLLPHRTIFRQISPRLPHHPDRRNGFAFACQARAAAALSPCHRFCRLLP